MKIKFINSPVPAGYGYASGETAIVGKIIGNLFQKHGFAEFIDENDKTPDDVPSSKPLLDWLEKKNRKSQNK